MSKRKNPASPHTGAGGGRPGGGSLSALRSSDPKLLPRITSYLSSLPPDAGAITSNAIVDHLRAKYPDYARKPKEFNKQVERLCEHMRAEAMAEAQQGVEQPAVANNDAASADAMSDVVIIGSNTPTSAPSALASPSSASGAASSFAQSISFAAPAAGAANAAGAPSLDRSVSMPVTLSAADSGAAAKKRRKDGDPSASPAQLQSGGSGATSDDSGDDSDDDSANNSVVELSELSVSGGGGATGASGGGVNSAMRNLYNKKAAPLAQGASAANADGAEAKAASSSAPRKSKEKIVYTQNSVKKSTKKKAATLRAAARFTSNDGGPDDAAAAGAGGGGGTGSDWQPEVLYPTTTYADLGGIEGILQEIRELVEYPLSHPEIYSHLGVQAPRGVLLHGPPGCGKTLLAHCIAGELGVPFLKISAPEVVSGMSGESEQKIRNLFQTALAHAPCLMFIDEIDAITPKRATAQREMERRIVAQLLTCMDSLSTSSSGSNDPTKIVIVIGATNRPDSLDSALRRAGRFDREISLGIPDEAARARILSVMCRDMKVEGGLQSFDWTSIAKRAVGYVGADLMALTREAAVLAINRIFRTVLPTPALRPQVAQHITGAEGGLPPLSLINAVARTTSPRIEAMNNPPAAPGVQSAAALALTESLTAAAAAASSSSSMSLVPSSSSPRLVAASQHAHLIPDPRSSAAQSELHSRTRASEKLRAHIEPLSEEQLAPLFITYADFGDALKKVQPSSKREGFATIPDVTWNDIGALDDLREELNMTILQPILNPQQFESIGLTVPAGVLLFGPPGCGKTLVAKAIANESGASFLSIKGPELLNQYVGQSERAVRKVFQRARASAPCVIFFDELDALVPKRGGGGPGGDGGSQVSERVVNQLLTEMDGLEERRFVFVIAATNRPDIIDPAMLRPGRLDKLLYVKLPSAGERAAILRKHLRRTPLSNEVDVTVLAHDPRGEGFSGADIAALCREATLQALREAQHKQRTEMASKGLQTHTPGWASMTNKNGAGAGAGAGGAGASSGTPAFNAPPLPVLVNMSHFDFAFGKVFPSVSHASRLKYDKMHRMLCRARSTLSNDAPGTANGATNGAAANAGATAAIVEEEEDAAQAAAGGSVSLRSASSSPLLAPPQQPSQGAMLPPLPKQLPQSGAGVPSFATPAAAAAAAPHSSTILGSMTTVVHSTGTGSHTMDMQ